MTKQISKPLYEIPTYNCKNSSWSYTNLHTVEEFRSFVEEHFKYPGQYEFDEDTLMFNAEGRKFNETKVYNTDPFKSQDFIKYWDFEKQKCRFGLRVIGKTGKSWYITRDYYMWINFLPIFHKDKRQLLFPDIYDGQYHTALYELLAELYGKHAVILKKRQYAMSYFHMAKFINQIWFEPGVTLKLIAYLDGYINMEGDWAFLEEYRDFLNKNTAWVRNFDPDKTGNWLQRLKATVNGRNVYIGRKGRIINITTQQSPTKGVGGASRYIIAEESGINPTLDKTYGYAKSALESGPFQIVGQFIAYGSVGDLKQCGPLRKFMFDPEDNGFFGVETSDFSHDGRRRTCGLFIPETWNMYPYSDQWGNSMIEQAKATLLEKRRDQEKKLDPEDFQLEISQHPLTIEEAFDVREESPFPKHLVQAHIRRIEEGVYPAEYVELFRKENGHVDIKPSKNTPINEFPLKKNASSKEKEGVVVIYERPDKDLVPYVTYYASIDPVHTGKTDASRSLCSIFIYKNPIERTIELDDGKFQTSIEGDKIVAEWCGRLDNIEDIHERCELLVEYYKAWTLIEYNGSFATYMIAQNKVHYLVPSNMMIFNKELSHQKSPNHPYGWKNVGSIFKTHILPYGIEYCKEVLDSEVLTNGNKLVKAWGITRIQGAKMLCKEMLQYVEGENVDRLVAYCALIAFAKIQQAARGHIKAKGSPDDKDRDLDKSKNLYKFKSVPFNNVGVNKHRDPMFRERRNPFKNFR